MSILKRRTFINKFFKSQLSYFPLECMCHSRDSNSKPNILYDPCWQIIYFIKQSSFTTLLERDGSVYIHNEDSYIHNEDLC